MPKSDGFKNEGIPEVVSLIVFVYGICLLVMPKSFWHLFWPTKEMQATFKAEVKREQTTDRFALYIVTVIAITAGALFIKSAFK